ncbi:IgGFc-binding protein [Polyangium sp. 6x1]|uniref:IgGFc-binding protein n=1 Tax=Polyangium sp. 6x1 TaxID=3042689 RepID=UPI002482AFFE|nr:IgGFc-binding protein [Polyangium sp. 6x1]MDI1449224.1 IgGFc-binding protein [Polyangium sp. 6x1]
MNERSRRSKRLGRGVLVLGALVVLASCFDKSTRWEEVEPKPPPPPACVVGLERCTTALERCTDDGAGPAWTLVEDCAAEGLVCAPTLLRCTACLPNDGTCKGQEAYRCNADGTVATLIDTCDASKGIACRLGSCVDLCGRATVEKSNVGCEYWAVDLDNARIDATSNAAAQQFAVVVSNPHPDVAVSVHIAQDDSLPGSPAAPYDIATAVIAPLNLQVFKLGPREVDGSPEGEYDTGTHTALTRHAFRIRSDFPVVAYQFNPLENVNVFSNDASLLKPTEALSFGVGDSLITSYVVVGWPQTIAATDDPDTNFNPNAPIHLRSFLTVVGTQPDTLVRVKTAAKVVGGGPVLETPANGTIEVRLDAFDVLNLETGDFNADFTGSTIESTGPIAVFTGGEASDAPHFPTLAYRRCCADHLEDQLDPVRTAGKSFAIPHTPSRTHMVKQAGGLIDEVPEPDYVRFVAASKAGAKITTSLPPPYDVLELKWLGDSAEVTTYRHFTAESTEPVIAAQIMSSQDAAGVRRGLPGGDPSLLIVPPLEQARPDYVFLTPDKYAFDYISIVVPAGQGALLDEMLVDADACAVAPADGLTLEERGGLPPELLVYDCQLSFPLIESLSNFVITLPGKQNDGVHRVVAGVPILVLVGGFDSYVSYSYAAGTDLREIALPQ